MRSAIDHVHLRFICEGVTCRMIKCGTAFVIAFSCAAAFGSQPLETETARLLPAGAVKLEGTGEYQKSSEGTERAVPLVVEYGITARTELMIEPVFGTRISQKGAPVASGAGDLEVTLTHLVLEERRTVPAIALAGEIKIPTAHNRLIGTGKPDYTGYLIASKRFGRIDLHANVGYTVVGSPPGTSLSNILDYAVAEELHVSPRLDLVGEVIGNTASTGQSAEGVSNPGVPAEAAAAETTALLGARYYARKNLFVAIGVSYDNNHALLIRPGITYRFGGR